MKRLLVSSSALLWGVQSAFLSPVLALILTELYAATTAEVGWVLAASNASGFVAALVLPAWADRRHNYLALMMASAILTAVLAVLLAIVTTLPLAALVLIVLGGPAGIGSSMLFAHLRQAGARPADIVKTRAIISVAWVAGPPVAAAIIGWFGNRAILLAITGVAGLSIATTTLMINRHRADTQTADTPAPTTRRAEHLPRVGRAGIVLITAAFVLLQATNATGMSIMTVYVTQTLGLDVLWAGIALGVAAALEVPALLLIGRLSERHSHLGLIATSCLAGIAYYLGLAFVTGPIPLIALQLLNAWSFAGIAGIGLTLFQELIPRPGLSTGLYMNTRRVGAIVSGPIIAVGSLTALGQRGIFIASAAITLLGLIPIAIAGRRHPAGTSSTPQA